jgi:hypothetical protein
MEDAGISLHAWATIEDVLDAGVQAGSLDKRTADAIRDYVREG